MVVILPNYTLARTGYIIVNPIEVRAPVEHSVKGAMIPLCFHLAVSLCINEPQTERSKRRQIAEAPNRRFSVFRIFSLHVDPSLWTSQHRIAHPLRACSQQVEQTNYLISFLGLLDCHALTSTYSVVTRPSRSHMIRSISKEVDMAALGPDPDPLKVLSIAADKIKLMPFSFLGELSDII